MVNFQGIVRDWGKVGTMLAVSHAITGGKLTDRKWQMSSLYTIIGFNVYEAVIRYVVDTSEMSATTAAVVNDILKVGTMLVVSRLLAGGSLTDTAWITSTCLTIVGFVAYDLLTSQHIQGKDYSDNDGVVDTINDWVKFSTMFVVSRALNCESLLDKGWLMSSMAVLVGFAVYNFTLRSPVHKASELLP